MGLFSKFRKLGLIRPVQTNGGQLPVEKVVVDTVLMFVDSGYESNVSLDKFVVKDIGLMSEDVEDLYPMLEKSFHCKPPISEYRADMTVGELVTLFEKYRKDVSDAR